jgi:hypothetical protein
MDVVVQSDYQDIYRITGGVLLVVNKFKEMEIDGVKYPRVGYCRRINSRLYKQGCQNHLKILTKEYKKEESCFGPAWSAPSGTVCYCDIPVEIAPKEEWEYQIKTSGESFSGRDENMIEFLREIELIIKKTGEGSLVADSTCQ